MLSQTNFQIFDKIIFQNTFKSSSKDNSNIPAKQTTLRNYLCYNTFRTQSNLYDEASFAKMVYDV